MTVDLSLDVPVLGHGLVEGASLPMPVLLVSSAAAVLGLAGGLSARSRAAAPERPQAWRRPLPRLTRLAGTPGWRIGLRTLGVVLALVVLLPAALGVDRAARNPAPRLVFTVFWGGLVPASLLLGPVWRAVNPLRAVSAGLARLLGDPHEVAVRAAPANVGLWTAVAGLAMFTWLRETGSDRPSAVLVFLVLYGLAQVGAAVVYGRSWYDRGDAFEVYSGLLGRIAPLGRTGDGALVLRNPLVSVAQTPTPAGFAGLIAVLLGADLFDLMAATAWWQGLVLGAAGWQGAVATGGLVACWVATLLLVRVALPRSFLAPALIPVVAGWAFAHHLAPLLVDTQTALAQLSDPLDRGWNLLGLTGRYASYDVLPVGFAVAVQLGVFVGAHLVAVAVAHRLAVARYDLRTARAVQFPLRAVLLVSLVAGLLLRGSG